MSFLSTADPPLGLPAAGAKLFAHLARNQAEVREAQRLRHFVFAEEMSARLASQAPGLDCDRIDRHCRHLLLRDGTDGEVVGTYRLLDYQGARAAGGFYAESEFDLRRILHLAPWMVEIGRACIHPAHRGAAAITELWSALMRHIVIHGYQFVIGCASVETGEGGHVAASICRELISRHLGPPEWRVAPRRAFVLEGWADIANVTLPGLIKGYLHLGARVCGDPAWDPDFRTADLLMMLSMNELNSRYAQRLLRHA